MIPPEKLTLLEAAAIAAAGRPELRCQIAMADIYKAAGLLPMELDIPEGNRNWARAQGRSLITPWVEDCGFFEAAPAPAQPGDLLGFRLGHVLHHVAIQLEGGRMVHVFGEHGVQIAVCIPEPWAKRLEKIWRLK
ncbi:MAG TPA: NlpC/P60 family protein [Lacunisphaera sp.]|nr:NlpC/P60 family protein [Lacunisphaera sp.]